MHRCTDVCASAHRSIVAAHAPARKVLSGFWSQVDWTGLTEPRLVPVDGVVVHLVARWRLRAGTVRVVFNTKDLGDLCMQNLLNMNWWTLYVSHSTAEAGQFPSQLLERM